MANNVQALGAGAGWLRLTPRASRFFSSFTPDSWDEPQTIQVESKSDDDLVRLKREVASGRGDHAIEHSIQFTTDRSYKAPDLKWSPSASLSVTCTE